MASQTQLAQVFTREELTGGTRLIVADQPAAPSATALVMYGVGSRFERPEESGIAHFAEHMFFKGTERRPTARDISLEVDRIGGEFNAFTGKEYTGYYVKCAAEHLELAIDVLSDQLLHSRFDAEEIEREKGVILEEMNMYRDTPARYVGNVYDHLLFGDQPLGWDIIGNEQTIKGATRDTFMGFIDRWYTGNRCVVGLAGQVSQGARDMATDIFSAVAPPTSGTAEAASWKQTEPQVMLHKRDSEQAHLILGLRAPGTMHADRYALGVLNAILGGGMSSRLFVEVRERRGLCYYVRSMHDAYVDTGSLAVAAGVDTDRIDEAVSTIVDELWKFLADAPDGDELDKAKNFLKGRFVLGVEDPKGLIMFGARREAVEGELLEPHETLAAIDAVTHEDVMRVARNLLDRNLLNLAIVGPFEDEQRFLDLLKAAPAA
jgi:predicted Zn-dependent peptidase